jgi:hypothetical protein
MAKLPQLKVLEIVNCHVLSVLVPVELYLLKSLEKLMIAGCNSLVGLQPEIAKLSSAKLGLRSLPEDISQPERFRQLTIGDCGRFNHPLMKYWDSKLEVLQIQECPKTRVLDLLEDGMTMQNTLTAIDLRGNDLGRQAGFPKLWKFLSRCPRIGYLNFSDNAISNLDGFPGLEETKQPSFRLRTFHLSRNPVIDNPNEEDTLSLLRILSVHKELCNTDFHGSKLLSHPEVVHYLMDINKAGRILLSSTSPTPLSIWPTVLARVNTLVSLFQDTQKKRRANAIYHLLRNEPALASRGRSY